MIKHLDYNTYIVLCFILQRCNQETNKCVHSLLQVWEHVGACLLVCELCCDNRGLNPMSFGFRAICLLSSYKVVPSTFEAPTLDP